MMRRILLASFLLCISASFIYSLETRSGQIKIVLDEVKGTFSFYKINTGNTPDESFFLDEDTRTTSIFVLIDNRVYRMGQNSFFTQKAELTETGARFVWENPAYNVFLDFNFISSTGGSYSDGVNLSFSIENLSANSHNIGIRFLFDTYLDESDGAHFKLASGEIKKETEFKESFPDWWGSGIVQVMMKSRGTTPPERVVFANWKRLNDNSWFYESRENRNFNLLPYSINDSAVSHYYAIKPLESKKTRVINIFLGIKGEKGFQEMSSIQTAGAAEPVVAVNTGDKYNLLQAIEVDLIQVNKILEELEAVIDKNDDINSSVLNELEAKVKELKERQSRYSVE